MNEASAQPKLAATVVLVRDGAGLEVLMVRRHSGLAFAPSAWVFPGGKAAEADEDPAWAGSVTEGFTEAERALRVAAAREVFEESGLILAREAGGEMVSAEACAACEDLRERVEAAPDLFLSMVRERGWTLMLEQLIPFAHWVTPRFETRRFDAHFFLAVAPPGQVAHHDGREAVDHVWINPARLLDMRLRGEARVMFPTRLNLELLAPLASAAEAEQTARSRRVVTVESELFERDGHRWLRIPAEAGYSVTEERMDWANG